MIIHPPETLPEELFDIGALWTPDSTTPAEVLPDIQPPQSNCASYSSYSSSTSSSSSSYSSSSASVAGTLRTPLTNVTNTIIPATLTAAAYTANRLAEDAQIVATQPLMSILAGIGEIEDRKVVVKRKRSPNGKRKVGLDAEGNEVVVEKKPRVPKKPKKAKEEAVHHCCCSF